MISLIFIIIIVSIIIIIIVINIMYVSFRSITMQNLEAVASKLAELWPVNDFSKMSIIQPKLILVLCMSMQTSMQNLEYFLYVFTFVICPEYLYELPCKIWSM